MNDDVKVIRKNLQAFIRGRDPLFIFEVPVDASQRISYIYSIIFPGFSKIKFYINFMIARLAQFTDYSPLKIILYRITGMKIGKGVFLSPDVILDPHFPELIELGDYTIVGWGTHFFCHEFDGVTYRAGRIITKRGAVIGGFSIIRGGVVIGENAKVASTCIVYKDVPANYYLDSLIILNRSLLEVHRSYNESGVIIKGKET